MDFAAGGYIPGSVTVTIQPDECILALRDGHLICIRDHDHDLRLLK